MSNRVCCKDCAYACLEIRDTLYADNNLYAKTCLICCRPGVSVIAEVTEDDWCIFGEVFDGSRFEGLSSCDELEEIENGKEEITGNRT